MNKKFFLAALALLLASPATVQTIDAKTTADQTANAQTTAIQTDAVQPDAVQAASSRPADTLEITTFRYAGPVAIQTPYLSDTLNNEGKPFEFKQLLSMDFSDEPLRTAPEASSLTAAGNALHLLGFQLENRNFAKARLSVQGQDDYEIYMDGVRLSSPELKLEPGTHTLALRVLTLAGKPTDLNLKLITQKGGPVVQRQDGKRLLSLDLNTQGENCQGLALSPSGKLLAVTHVYVDAEGTRSEYTELIRLSDRQVLFRSQEPIQWMPVTDEYYYTRPALHGRDLLAADPLTGRERVLCRCLPEGEFTLSSDGKTLFFSIEKEGPAEGDVHQILTPDDRQPGWRNRSYLARFDMATGLLQPLTFGYRNAWLSDVSADGSHILFMTVRERLTARPTSLMSVFRMDPFTLQVDTLVADDGFLDAACFSPDGRQVLLTGSPECLGGIGNVTPEGRYPSMVDKQLYVMDIDSKSVRPITKDLAPCVAEAVWSHYDGQIYAKVEEKDCYCLYRLNPQNGQAAKLPAAEDYLYSFELAQSAPVLAYGGQSLEWGDRVHLMDTRRAKDVVLLDLGADRFEGVEFGQGGEFEFTSSRGDLINGFYVLPPDFDASKKYPLIVHYYGGCSPSTRYSIGSYSPQWYAAQGYVFYVVNPSGASGFGQEFSSRHVNTAGDVVADDIIEGTQAFCRSHAFVDSTRIGCFSASYGGFMTQLLLAKTDLFATGISHAGISDHTSYWGEGYWGYNYSEVSMAGSYPWTRPDLYVDHSPLYFADRIHRPLLFLHGSADTNVPIGESIQMFTALKLLGNETAFVVVDGENHGIRDYAKRRQWLRTISAWFAKYLKDDATWWDELYPPKTL